MKKIIASILMFFSITAFLTSCGPIGDKAANLNSIYGITTFLSFIILLTYCIRQKQKDKWYLLLFISIFIVNIGYFALGTSQTLKSALMYNRISYFGSVFLPLSMLMIILNSTRTTYHRFVPIILFVISILMFFITASPGYSTIYYESVDLVCNNGISVLEKTYGPWHSLYLFYLLGYFGLMIAIIFYSSKKKTMETTTHAVILTIAVFVNIGVWLIEQIVDINFEFLSISYIITELFLLSLQFLMTENSQLTEKLKEQAILREQEKSKETEEKSISNQLLVSSADSVSKEIIQHFLNGVNELTPTERKIYDAYIVRATTKEIRESLCITENTLKFHNKNIYSKLGVSSRKQLMEIYKSILVSEAQ
jgi:DNA-binding CsgD family transcriptional regulator